MIETSKALEFKATLEEKKKEALKASNPVWKTSGEFRPNIDSERGYVKLKAANRVQIMSVYKDMKYHAECAKELQFEDKHLGFEAKLWMEDCLTRSAVLRMIETLSDIAILENDLRENILSGEELKAIAIEDMTDKIAKL